MDSILTCTRFASKAKAASGGNYALEVALPGQEHVVEVSLGRGRGAPQRPGLDAYASYGIGAPMIGQFEPSNVICRICSLELP